MGRKKKEVATAWKNEVPQPINLAGRGKINSMDEIFGYANAKYNTHDVDEYEHELTKLTFADLQKECTRVGIYPQYEREKMMELLLKGFNEYQLLRKGPQMKPVRLAHNDESRQIMGKTQSTVVK